MKYPYCLVLILVFWACSKNNQSNTDDSETHKELVCFKNEYPYEDDSGLTDIEELTLNISGNEVTGEYNWLPAEKDQRKGKLKGTVIGKTISAKYVFMQEGIEDNADLTIIIENDKAIITGGDAELGLEAQLKKTVCK